MDGGAAEPPGRGSLRCAGWPCTRLRGFPLGELPVGQLHRAGPDSPYAEAHGDRPDRRGARPRPPRLTANPAGRLSTFYAHRSRPVRVMPLVARGSVLGFVFYSRTETREPLDEQDITLGDELAARAAVAIDNALLYRRERRRALARQQALDEANAAQERLALLNEASTRIGTTLDLQRTAEELVEVVLPRFADFVTVDLLESVMRGDEPTKRRCRPAGRSDAGGRRRRGHRRR